MHLFGVVCDVFPSSLSDMLLGDFLEVLGSILDVIFDRILTCCFGGHFFRTHFESIWENFRLILGGSRNPF